MKTRESYRVTAVRLVAFHNLGTTTVELPEGGHLFLLGDNGSGKTTLLDAIHLVLTAGREMEFNSAARVAGAKDSGGRTYQGIVLRYNAATGRAHYEQGVSYAALELRSDSGRVLSLAVGLAAAGMDVAIERWGALASVPVADLPLTVTENGRVRATAPGEFKKAVAALTGGRAYAHINEYADAVGERLFGGAEKYADVCKLLRTGKAYREIAARAANYDELFRQLLEDPSRDTFEPLLKGLRELEESKAKLDQIDERARYLTDLQRESDRLADRRLKLSLVDWAEAEATRMRAERQAEQLSGAIASGVSNLKDLERRALDVRAETERLRGRLAELRARDASGLVAREKQARLRLERAQRHTAEAREAAEAANVRLADGQKALGRVQKERATRAKAAGESLLKSGKNAGIPLGRLGDALFALANGAEDASVEAAFEETRRAVVSGREARTRAAYAAEQAGLAAQQAYEAASDGLKRLTDAGESLPQVEGFALVRASLRSAMRKAQPVYELLEPAPGCDARHLAVLERFLGDDFLATWVVEPEQADAVRKLVWSEGSSSVAERGRCGAVDPTVLTPWLGNYLSYAESDPEAVRLVAAQLASAAGPCETDFLGRKTWNYRFREGLFPDAKPRLIGRRAREAEQARLVRVAEARLTESERQLRSAQKAQAEADRAVASAKELEESLEETRVAVWRLNESCRQSEASVRRADETAREAAERWCARQSEESLAKDELEDLHLQMREAGIDDSLERKIASLEKKVEAGADAERRVHEDCGRVNGQLKALREQQDGRRAESVRAAETAAQVVKALADAVPRDVPLPDFVRRTAPELLDAHADFVAHHERLVAEARVAETAIGQKVRDARGEAYAFAFDAAANVITDRRGSRLEEVIADESRRLDELRDVIDRKSREVFERIFMGEVMQRLYVNCLQIVGLVKRIQRNLAGCRFGSSQYQFCVSPLPEYEGFVDLVRNVHRLDDAREGKDELRTYLEAHREEIMNADIDAVPPLFDYRKWFRFQLKVQVENEEGKVIDRKLKSMGSGGEQAVPNYLLILTVAEFLYHGSEASDPPKLAPLLFDEAFYGIDAARRDQLLAFADKLGLQLFVSSPDQDGVKREIRRSVSLIVVKDENLDVHLSPINWNNTPVQGGLFGDEGPSVGMTVMEETR